MATVTAIEERSAESGRYIIYLDGAAAGLLSANVIHELGIRVGDTLDVRGEDRLRDAFGVQQVFEKSLQLLAVRARSTAELRRKLLQKGAGPHYVEAALQRLTALGYLNDDVYAREVVSARLVRGGVSKRRVQQELFKRGVSRDLADSAVEEAVTEHDIDETEAAVDVARRRLASLRALDPAVRRRRLYGFLARRGYDADAIAEALRRVLKEASEEDVED